MQLFEVKEEDIVDMVKKPTRRCKLPTIRGRGRPKEVGLTSKKVSDGSGLGSPL